AGGDVLLDKILDSLAVHALDSLHPHPALTLDDADDVGLLAQGVAADLGVVHFHVTREQSVRLVEGGDVLNSVKHEPSGFLSDPEFFGQFYGRYSCSGG